MSRDQLQMLPSTPQLRPHSRKLNIDPKEIMSPVNEPQRTRAINPDIQTNDILDDSLHLTLPNNKIPSTYHHENEHCQVPNRSKD